MKLALGSDHRGYALKQELLRILTAEGHTCRDFGTHNTDPVDYPDFAEPVARAVGRNEFDLGILVCGTGIGMSVTANKVAGVRAALCHDSFTAQRAREHTNANVLCLGAEQLDAAAARMIIEAYLKAKFEPRHQPRLDKVARLEKGPASVAEAKASYESASPPAPQGITGDEATEFLRTAPHPRARRTKEARRRMLAFIEQIEKEAAASGVKGPTDISENLDRYLYDGS
ncbi:MAG: ribose 5-phosphate isomerase B [Chloroflexi bacterium]|nr:ribose 5-phosphate isomerase B [Chloroflexota bacterium]